MKTISISQRVAAVNPLVREGDSGQGGTGYQPVPFGNLPNGMGKAHGFFRLAEIVGRLLPFRRASGPAAQAGRLCHPNPNGVPSISPGLRGTSYPGCERAMVHNPEGVASHRAAQRCNPVGVENHFAPLPRVGAPRANPGLRDAIPLGLKTASAHSGREGKLQVIAGLRAVHGVADGGEVRKQDGQGISRQFDDGDAPVGEALLIPEILSAVTSTSKPSRSAASSKAPFLSSAQPRW